MNAKFLIEKAKLDIAMAKKNLDDTDQHDSVGYSLAQACEKILQALSQLHNLPYPQAGHDLDKLMTGLENAGVAWVSSHEDVLLLAPYLNRSRNESVRAAQRVDLNEFTKKSSDFLRMAIDAFNNAVRTQRDAHK